MRILVTDGHNRAALAITRSLGRAGHEVIVGERTVRSLAQSSRFCSRSVVYPDPVSQSDAFIDFLTTKASVLEVEAVIPVSDITTLLVAGSRHRFEPSCAVPVAPIDIIERAGDKVDMVRTALRLGVPAPTSIVIESADERPPIDLPYPVVVKPARSRVRTVSGWQSCSVSYAASRGELWNDLVSRPAHEFPVMVQERIVGPGTGVFAYYHQGRPVALFSHRRLRERPPWGGVSVLAESVEMCPQARAYATRLLEEIGWQGVAMVEFKRDLRDGLPKLMEINGRFWGSLQLAIDAGVDFPRLLVEGIRQDRFEPQAPYRVGVQTRWWWGDVDSLILTMMPGERAPGRPLTSRMRTLAQFLRLTGKNLYYDNPKPGDIRPWLWETRLWLKGASPTPRATSDAPVEASPSPVVSAPPTLRVRAASSFEDSGVSVAEWNDLVARSETRSVFQTYEWLHSWWRSFRSTCDLRLLTVTDGPRPVAVAPLVSCQQGAKRVVRFIGDGRADYSDILVGERRSDAIASVLSALHADPAWHVLELNNIPEVSSTASMVAAAAEGLGYHVLIEPQFLCPSLVIRAHEEEAMAIRDKASVRRKRHKLDRLGNVAVRHLQSVQDIEPLLDTFFEQHVDRWAPTESPSLFLRPENREFYRALARELAPVGRLLFTVLELDGRPIAMHYGFVHGGVLTWYKPSFDRALLEHSPGTVMVGHLVAYAIEKGYDELDFTLGNEAFKNRFTNTMRRTVRVRVFRSRTEYLAALSKRGLAHAFKDLRS